MTTPRLALAATLVLIATAAGWSVDVASAAPAPVKLSITVTDDATLIHPKSATEYSATVTNQGSRSVRGTLVLTTPDYLRYAHVRGNGKITNGDVRWKITVGAGQAVTERVTVRVQSIPKSAVRVTTLASFYLGRVTDTPVIRTADADRIPGVKDPAPVAAPRTAIPKKPHREAAASDSAGFGALGWSLVGGGAVLVLLAAGLLARRWRRRGPESESETDQPQPDREAEMSTVQEAQDHNPTVHRAKGKRSTHVRSKQDQRRGG
jgi:hypothetical protein